MQSRPPLISLACETDAGLGQQARLGLIVLQTDQTLEHEFRFLLDVPDVACYHSRIANAMEVTPQTLAQMEVDLPRAAALLPKQFAFDAIAYGCTSGTTVIGEHKVEAAVQQAHPQVPVTNPLTACKAAFKALGMQRIAFLTPYRPDVTELMRQKLQDSGFDVVCTGSFQQSDDFVVGRISPDSLLKAMQQLVAETDCCGVFVSCTSLRVAEILPQAEQLLGMPVTSSNHAMAWHLLRLANYSHPLPDRGQLFTLPLI
ncbi:MAG: Asp/Glu racemase [Gammaproteobacteria bacterium]|nr:Asp/Glu racemase [Gammaproteobacteria bacterium]MCP4880563.1 Asp/Glu racemase [Gammaproteobacteria bacterium]